MKTTKLIIKIIIAVCIVYFGVSYLDWDFKWYERLANEDGVGRFLLGIAIIGSIALFYYVLNFLEDNL